MQLQLPKDTEGRDRVVIDVIVESWGWAKWSWSWGWAWAWKIHRYRV